VVKIRTIEHRCALMNRFDDPFYSDAFSGCFSRSPNDAVAGHQRSDGAADVAAVNATVGGFYVSMHAETANDHAFCCFAEQVVVVIGFLRSGLKTAFMVGIYAALLPFGEFI